MAQTVSVIGIDPNELRWLRTLVLLLRHPDPSIPELARQALMYLSDSAAKRTLSDPAEDYASSGTADPNAGCKTRSLKAPC